MPAATTRTRGEARAEAILAAATKVFLEQGFAGATLDAVIAKAGGSRATLYAQFGNKEGLFAAIIADACARMLSALDASVHSQRSPRATLTAFATQFLDVLLDPASLALYRVVAAEGQRFAGLGEKVFAAGPTAAADRLAAYLKQASADGTLTIRNPPLAARVFLEGIKGELHTRALFSAGNIPTAAERAAVVRQAVDLFLDGCRSG